MSQSQYMLATYQVEVADRAAFIQELIATEAAYREEQLVTDAPIIRMSSKEDPEYLLEIIEFKSAEALSSLMENANVQAHWGKLIGTWKDGDIAADRVPEAHIPWAILEPIRP